MAKFNKKFLCDLGGTTVYDKIIGHRRWSVDYERVFRHEGRFYRTVYSRGATEGQDEQPYQYGPDEIECQEVIPVQRLVTVYEPAKQEA